MKNMTLSAVTKACGGIYFGDESLKETEVSSITTDSRTIQKDSLFIAIKGEKTDGHDYISNIYDEGALCCISEYVLEGETRTYIKVDSSLQALKDIAAYYRSVLDVKVIAVTGSVGKTSTKETIAAVLSQKYKVLKTLGNFNNEIGLPLTIFRLTEEDQIAVLEMGISDFGEMSRLSAIAKPDICVITNIGLCHLENLKNRDGVLKAKSEIFEFMNPDGSIILNQDDDKLITVEQVKGIKPYFFGIEHPGRYYAGNITNLGLDGISCTVHIQDAKAFDVTIPIPGYHMVYNALAAAASGNILGLSAEEIRNGIESLEPLSGRNHIVKMNGLTLIDDCYNANPVSMQASVDVLASALGRKVAVLGDMFELGNREKELHYELGSYIAGKEIHEVIAVGELSAEIVKGIQESSGKMTVRYFKTLEELLSVLSDILQPGDTVLVKASNGMRFVKIIELLRAEK